MKTALISGASGFVGSHLSEYLLKNTDWNLVLMIRWRSPLDNLHTIIPLANEGKRVKFVYADLLDTISIQNSVKEAKPDYVFHLAAQSYPKTSLTSPLNTLDTNIQGTVRLLDALKTYSPEALIHVCSSSEVYGKAKNIPINEDAPFHGTSPYSISKVGTDIIGQFYAQAYGLNIIVTRMFTHTGPRRGDVFAESTFAKQIAMIEAGLINPVIKVGNLDSLRTVADVRDAVRAYHMALTVNPTKGEVYNIGGTHTCTVGDILQALFSAGNVRFPIEIDIERMRPIDADLQVPDCSKFKSHTGWEPRISFKQTMSDLLEYWRKRVKTHVILQR